MLNIKCKLWYVFTVNLALIAISSCVGLFLILGEDSYLVFQCIPRLSWVDIEEDEFVSLIIGFYTFDDAFDSIEFLERSYFWHDAKLVEDEFVNFLDVLLLIELSISFVRCNGDGLGFTDLHADDCFVYALDGLTSTYDERQWSILCILIEE